MGLRFKPIAIDRWRRIRTVAVRWDGSGASKCSLSDIAQGGCCSAGEVLEDIARIPKNQAIADLLWKSEGKAYFLAMEKRTNEKERVKEYMWLYGSTKEWEGGADLHHPSKYLSKKLKRRIGGLLIAKLLGASFGKWSVDLKQATLILTLNATDHQWKKCRKNDSILVREKDKVAKYKKAVSDLVPFLKKIERNVEAYEHVVGSWNKSAKGGRPYLEALALLNLVERVTDIYSEQDLLAQSQNTAAKALAHKAGQVYEEKLRKQTLTTVKQLRRLYRDSSLCKALNDYLLQWDPYARRYYHTVVARAAGAPAKEKGKPERFDERLFRAISKLCQYASLDPTTSKEVGGEMSATLDSVWAWVPKQNSQIGGPARAEAMRAKAHAKVQQLLKSKDAGVLTTFAVWSGYVCTFMGNFEGPPSVLSLGLVWFSKSDQFLTMVKKDTLLKAFAMVGVDVKERLQIDHLIKKGKGPDYAAARKLFEEGSWRSTQIFAVFSLMGIAILVYHIDGFLDELKRTGDRAAFNDKLVKQVILITQDASNLALTAFTIKHARDVAGFVKENLNAQSSTLKAGLDALETKQWRVVGVKAAHGTMAALGVVLSVWDIHDNWGQSDHVEQFVLVGTVCSSVMSLLGVATSVSWLGPMGFIAGVLLGAVMALHQYMKPNMEKTLRGLLAHFEKSTFYKRHKALVAGEKVYLRFFKVDIGPSSRCLRSCTARSSITNSAKH